MDKVLAVFGRAEARDFMDLMAIEDQFGLDRLFRAAADKDHGFDLKVFVEMTDRFDRLRRDEFPLDDQEYGRLARLVTRWRTHARELDREQGRLHEPGHDRGDDLGIGY